MTPLVVSRWKQVAKTADLVLLDALLADDVVFESPVVHTPQTGRAITTLYLTGALKVLNGPDFRYLNHWYGERSAVLELETKVEGLVVNGIDTISCNADDRINRFKVMIRPLKAINAVHEAMGKLLAAAKG